MNRILGFGAFAAVAICARKETRMNDGMNRIEKKLTGLGGFVAEETPNGSALAGS
jgi:hypothetical protein